MVGHVLGLEYKGSNFTEGSTLGEPLLIKKRVINGHGVGKTIP